MNAIQFVPRTPKQLEFLIGNKRNYNDRLLIPFSRTRHIKASNVSDSDPQQWPAHFTLFNAASEPNYLAGYLSRLIQDAIPVPGSLLAAKNAPFRSITAASGWGWGAEARTGRFTAQPCGVSPRFM